jgi:uncharacterized membrane protein YfcA
VGASASEPGLLFAAAVAGAAAAAINAVAGGGSLVSFPVLVALGVPPLPANATNAVALWPGSLAGALGQVERYATIRGALLALLGPTLLGAGIGAMLLVATDQSLFDRIVPALVLAATLVLAFQKRVRAWAKTGPGERRWAAGAFQFLVAVYGGYFGAGMGILMLAVFGLFLAGDLHDLNAIKNWLALAVNVAATVLFFSKGLVWLWVALAMAIGATAGGYAAARLSERVDAERLRRAVVVYGLAMTVWFAWRAFVR